MYKPVKEYSGASGDSWILTTLIVIVFGIFCVATLFVYGSRFSLTGMTYRGVTSQKNAADKILEGVQTIEIVNRYGNVSVEHESESGWTWDLTVWADTQEQADKLRDQVFMTVTEFDTVKQTWELVLPEDMSQCNGIKSNLVLHVPQEIKTVVTNEHGETRVSDISDAVTITSEHGDVSCRTCPGQLEIKSRHGDVVLQSFGGATINNRHGDLTIADSSNPVAIDSQHSDIRTRDVIGELRIENSHGDVDAAGIQGDVSIENRHGDIELNCHSQFVQCNNRHADTIVRIQNPSVQKVQIVGQHNDIDLSLPDSIRARLITDVKHGDVRSDIASEEAATSTIELSTSHGDIRIREHAVTPVDRKAEAEPADH